MAAATCLLAGCSTTSSMNPVNWWHQQEGGEIAKQRPAPPGADQPYPNLATVPAKPVPPNQEDLKKLTDSLIADRTNAQHAAEAAPISDPSSPTASPALFGTGSAPPPPPPGSTAGQGGASIASASLPAVTAAPPPTAPTTPAPRKAVQSAPLAPPAQTASAAQPNPPPDAQVNPTTAAPANSPPAPAARAALAASPPPTSGSAAPPGSAFPAPSTEVAAAAQPPLPAAPPPRPAVAGAPPPIPPPPSPMPEAGSKSAEIVFVQDSSLLSPTATDAVKAFAAQRNNAVIGVTGYGDTASSDPSAQSAALNLGLARAQSIVDALRAAGVPGNAIRVSAEASGRGASLHLLQ